MIGTIIEGTYRVDRLIGEGAYGAVYECEELQLGRNVALKILKPAEVEDRALRYFRSEIRSLAALNHPNVVHIYRSGTHDGKPYFAMEFVRGRSLRECIRSRALPTRETLELMHQVALGLAAIHTMEILHHDLSPNNIMITDSHSAKIVDLGLARDLNHDTTLSSNNYLRGTFPYLAPEQLEGRGTGFKSEIFSYGVILYEALTGQHPYWAEHSASLVYNITQRDPRPIESLLSGCPNDLAALVADCMEKRPEDRPRDMSEVAKRISRILELPGLETTSTSEIIGSHPPKLTPRNPYLNRMMIKRRDEFFGRGQEVKRIYARLNATPPGSVSVVGDRKIGKSSLLNHVYMRQNRQEYLEQPEKMVMVFLDLQEEKGMSMEAFVKILLGIASYELRGRLDISDCAHNLDGIKDMVQRLDAAGFRLAILLDEFECVTTNPNFNLEFFSFLRFLANHYNVAYLTSSARDLQVLCHTKEISDSPFFNIFSPIKLSAFQQHEAEELIRVPSERVNKPLAPHATQLIEIAGLFPFFIQMACSHAIEYLEDHPDTHEPDFREIRRRFYEEAKLHYRFIWNNFDHHEQSTILRVAKRKSLPDALKHVLDELEGRHYVEPDDGVPRLFAKTFDEFVRAEATKSSERSLLSKLFGGKKA